MIQFLCPLLTAIHSVETLIQVRTRYSVSINNLFAFCIFSLPLDWMSLVVGLYMSFLFAIVHIDFHFCYNQSL